MYYYFNLISVILSVVINLICYWFTTEVEDLQIKTRLHEGKSRVIVDFDISFYLVTAAGGLSIFATAFNCLRRHPVYDDSGQGEQLLDDMEVMLPPPELPPMPPAPPPYTP